MLLTNFYKNTVKLALIFLVFLSIGCDSEFRTTKSGRYKYQIITKGDGERPDSLSYVVSSVRIIDDADSLWLEYLSPYSGFGYFHWSFIFNKCRF